jgi:ubiquinone/menaquinone biosynthesis C-methylase UbiE
MRRRTKTPSHRERGTDEGKLTDLPHTGRVEKVRRRYNRLAPVYRLALALFLLPPGLRARSIERLDLQPGETVLEIGVGSGANLDRLVAAVGAEGQVIGIDVSPRMLARARRLIDRRGWDNVVLVEDDAERPSIEGPMDAVFFGLSYAVIPDPRAALREAWARLRPGGRIVIVEGYLPDNLRGRVLGPVIRAASAATVLGEIDRRPWDDLAELTDGVVKERRLLGMYVITSAHKPEQSSTLE